MDWDAFQTAWHDNGCDTLADLAAAHPGERLYAAAFHLFYGDGTQILPPEWRWDAMDAASDAMRPWYHTRWPT